MKLWPRTLGVQLIVVTAAAILLSNAIVAVWFELGAHRQKQAEINERILDRAAALGAVMASLQPPERLKAVEALEGKLWNFQVNKGPHIAKPMTAAEQALAAKLRAQLPAKFAHAPVEVHLRPWEIDIGPDKPPVHTEAMQMTLPVLPGTEVVATFVKPPAPPWPTEMLFAAILAVLIVSVAGIYIARRVARPLSQLAEASAAVARGQTAPRVPEVGPDDVRNAAEAFNAMAEQVRRTLESQRQLLSAVGHDLRTPLTAMRISLEFVGDSELRERLLRNLDELHELTEAVLSAAKGTGGEIRRQIDLSALAESICADLDDLGEPVQWQGHTAAPLSCRPNELRRAIRNLIENAVSYGKRAEVSLLDTPASYEIRVEDEGPGIPEKDRQRVFEPLVRLESSRSSETGGTGLGLTLVKAIAEGHGGTVVLEDRPGGGLRARLILPRKAMAPIAPEAV